MKHARDWTSFWHGGLALAILLLFAAVALAAPRLAPLDPSARPFAMANSPAFRLAKEANSTLPNPPNEAYLLGTVPMRRADQQLDVYHALIWGTRSALLFGLGATIIVSVFGSLVGAVSSFLGGVSGSIIMRVTDAFLTFPVIAAIVVFGQLLNPQPYNYLADPIQPGWLQAGLMRLGIDNVMLALVCFGWMPYARVIYADMERTRGAEYILAAQAAGVRPGRIIFRHLIPNSISNVIVLATKDVSGLVLLQATFTFVGVGGSSDWGQLLNIGKNWILGLGGNPLQYWWVFVPVTAALVLFGIGWNLLGDFLNERLNPRLRYEVVD